MTILQVQIFVLLLGAFLFGAATACLFRRAFFTRREEAPVVAVVAGPVARPRPAGASRFERALTGDPSNAVPTPFHSFKAPVVEVQPIPRPNSQALHQEPSPATPKLAEPVAPAPVEPPPAPPVVEGVPAAPAEAMVAPETQAELEPVPAAEIAEEFPAPVEFEAPAPPSHHELSYTEIALAANEAAAHASPVETPVESQPVAVEAPMPLEAPALPPHHEPSYTEIAEAANAAAAALAMKAFTADALASQAAAGPADDLTRIRSIDMPLQERLNQLGVRTFEDIASWTEADVARFSQTLGFYGRIEQENWIEQAQVLATGGAVEEAPERSPEDIAAAVGVPLMADHLHRIIGIDPTTEQILLANGVTRIADIAAWTAQDVEIVEALIGQPGRVDLENWIEQARFLVRGGAPREHAPIGYASELVDSAPPAHLPAAAPEPVSGPEPLADEAAELAPSARGDGNLAGLRSVRSEALLGDVDPQYLGGPLDDLKRIRGVGVLIERKLYSLGVTSYEQVANWTSADIARISEVLDFKGRIERENWVEQARILASGGQTEFSRRVDRGEV